jgi:CD109 antigen
MVYIRYSINFKIYFKIPSGLSYGGYNFFVNGSGGLTFQNKSYIEFRPKGMSIYVQMDKGIYKPGQTGKHSHSYH